MSNIIDPYKDKINVSGNTNAKTAYVATHDRRVIMNEAFTFQYDKEEVLKKIEMDLPIILKDVKIQCADTVNSNKRIYTRNTLDREFKRVETPRIAQGNAVGELDHPAQRDIVEMKTISHKIIKWWWKGNDVRADVQILRGRQFPMANILRGCLLDDIPVGFSSRGLGTEQSIGDGTFMVGDDYEYICTDAVSNPSTHGAYGMIAENVSKYRKDSTRFRNELNNTINSILQL